MNIVNMQLKIEELIQEMFDELEIVWAGNWNLVHQYDGKRMTN